jgi:hypothetical protein
MVKGMGHGVKAKDRKGLGEGDTVMRRDGERRQKTDDRGQKRTRN